MTTLIKNCRLVSPDVDMADAAIEMQGEQITRIHSAGSALPEADTVYDAEGKMAVPGFVDMHFHGALGHDVTDGSPEGIEEIARAKVGEGVTTICPTTLTLPEAKLAKAMEAVALYMGKQTYAKVAGVHLEGPFINAGCAGAQNPDYVRKPDIEEVRRLKRLAKVAVVSFAVETEGGAEFVRSLVAEGIVPSCGHSDATYAQFQEAKEAGLKQLTHFCNQMTKLHHREPGLVGVGLLDDDVLVELICDKIHLCPEMIALAFKSKPIEKIALITDSISASWLDDGNYDLGGLAVRVKGGAARLVSNDALAGSTLRFNIAFRNVAEVTGLPLDQLVKTTSLNQASALGLDGIGRIEPGCLGDIAVLDHEFAPAAVFVNGERRL